MFSIKSILIGASMLFFQYYCATNVNVRPQGIYQPSFRCGGDYEVIPEYAIVGSGIYNNARACNGCLHITNEKTNKTVIARLVDHCQPCNDYEMILSKSALEKLGDSSTLPYLTTIKYVPCSGLKGLVYYMWENGGDPSNFKRFSIQNNREALDKVEVSSDLKTWKELVLQYTNQFILKGISSPFSLRITTATGKVFLDRDVKPLIDGGKQERPFIF